MRRAILLSAKMGFALLAGSGDSKGSDTSAGAATTTTVKSSTATQASGATTTVAASGASVDNACTLATLDEVSSATKQTVIADVQPGSKTTCVYDTRATGIGDGTAALVKHQDNVKVYARKGTTWIAVTEFNSAADPTANAQQLMRSALGRL